MGSSLIVCDCSTFPSRRSAISFDCEHVSLFRLLNESFRYGFKVSVFESLLQSLLAKSGRRTAAGIARDAFS